MRSTRTACVRPRAGDRARPCRTGRGGSRGRDAAASRRSQSGRAGGSRGGAPSPARRARSRRATARARRFAEVAADVLGGDPVDTKRHPASWTLGQVPRRDADDEPRRPDKGLPEDRQLRPFLWTRNMHADTPGRVPARVACPRLVAYPGTCPEIVVVAGRKRDVHRVIDLAVTVRAKRRPVQWLPGLPREPAGVVRG